MRIRSVWVQSFGSLRSFAVPKSGELTDGLNILFGPNEAGKSQLKGFLEEILFPRTNQRGLKDARPLGRVGFNHLNARYELETAKKGSSMFRQLSMDNALVPGDVSDLFPSMKIAGNEVFSNLYSFGLDQLGASSTSANGALTEHLFGAVASGKGISVNSVFDRLEDQIKKLTGKDARSRSLTRVIEDLESANKKKLERIAAEESFMEKYRQRSEIVDEISDLEMLLAKRRQELGLYQEVQRMRAVYEQYVAVTPFLDEHQHLSELNPTLLRSLEKSFSRAQNLKDEFSGFETRLSSALNQSKALRVDSKLLDRQDKIRVAERIIEDVQSIQEEFSRKCSEFDAAKAEAAGAASSNAFEIDGYLDSMDSSKLPVAIDALESIRNSLDLLKKQWLERLASPLIDASREGLFAKQREADVSIRRAESLLEASTTVPAPKRGRSSIWGGIIGALAVIGIGVLYRQKIVSSPLGLAILAALGLTMAVVFFILARRQGKAMDSNSQLVNTELSHIGLESYEPRQILRRLSEFQQEKEAIDSVIQLQAEWTRLSELIDSYGIAMEGSPPFDKVIEKVSSLILLFRDIIELKRMKRIADQLRIRLEDRKSDLLELMNAEFSEIGIPADSSVDSLVVMVSNLVDALASNLGIKSEAEKCQRDIDAHRSELRRIQGLLDLANLELDEQLAPLGLNHEQIGEELMELFREYAQNMEKRTSFLQSAESVFGDQLQDVMPRFKMNHLEIDDSVRKLNQLINAESIRREELQSLKAEIDVEEKRLLQINPVAVIQASIESLSLEAEELADKLRILVLAKQLLESANSRFEELHQPELLRLSSEIFARVTQNRYLSILKKEYGKSESIFVRNELGQDIVDSSLSRGAREQLYISIRLALVTRANSLDIPLLMDDVLVNADIDRARGLAKELALVARNRQIIYFCAKSETLKLFEMSGAEFNVIEIERL